MEQQEAIRNGQVDRALVITDIVGSTPLVCHLGDETYQELIELHHHILIDSLKPYGGEYLRSRGDGVLVAFAYAQDALSWSLNAQQTVPEEVGVQIRIGAHFGSVRMAQVGYIGKALHIVARITDLAHAGEILTSKTFLVAAHQTRGGPCNTVRLRGLDEVTEIVSIATPMAPAPS